MINNLSRIVFVLAAVILIVSPMVVLEKTAYDAACVVQMIKTEYLGAEILLQP
jgi:hypothetical protein